MTGFCAVLYLLRSGCHFLPKWRTVPAYFQTWSELDEHRVGLLERALKVGLSP